MASKIIILSGNGRGIARVYEMTHKIRLEMDAVVAEKNKRLGVMINDALFTFPYDGRQIAIDLDITKIHKASLIVYSGGKCLLSGASNGKCDITDLMYKIVRYDEELERVTRNTVITDANNSSDKINNVSVNDENSSKGIDRTTAKNSAIDSTTIDDKTIGEKINIDIKSDNSRISELADEPSAKHISANKVEKLVQVENTISKTDNQVSIAGEIQNDSVDKNAEIKTVTKESIRELNHDSAIQLDENTDNSISDIVANSEIDYSNKANSSASKEHEVVAAMLEGKSEMGAESLPLGTVPFYEKIWHKIEEMFDIYQHDSVLEDLVYDSAWIRIPYEDDGYYVIGVISDDGKPVFICYGIPQEKMTRPDKEIEDSCEWLPIDKTDVSGRGYWLVYQDAMTGENIS